jgi:hypothetical protein
VQRYGSKGIDQINQERRTKEMKRILAIVLAAVLVLTAFPAMALAGVGNEVPSGKHFNINLIGAPNEKNANFDGGEGARIFVKRTGSTFFWVQGGDGFEILDHDGTDGKVGSGISAPGIIFPYTGTPGVDGEWRVQIYIRVVGPSGSGTDWTSYTPGGDDYQDPYGQWWEHFASFSLSKSSKFSLKTSELLSDDYKDMLWKVDPTGKFRICQMRIYIEEY